MLTQNIKRYLFLIDTVTRRQQRQTNRPTADKDKAKAKLFMHGRSQAIRLPKEFRFKGKEVQVSRVGDKVILEPIEKPTFDMKAWRAKLRAMGTGEFLPEGRPEQPQMPKDKESELSFDMVAAELRKLTRKRKQTPSEILLREGRGER